MIHLPFLPPSFNPRRNSVELVRSPDSYFVVDVDPYLKLLYVETEFARSGHDAELRGIRIAGWTKIDKVMRRLIEVSSDKPIPVWRYLELTIVGAYATMDYPKEFEKAKQLYEKAKTFVGDLEIAIPL